MKIKLVFIYLFLIGSFGHAQQWIDKKYEFTSNLNVVYGTAINFNGGIDTLKLDLYQPICDDSLQISTKPLLIWIHGGAFIAGNKSDISITNLCKEFAKRGYVTASLNYRLGFVSDDLAWNCNFPNYSCVFATDTAEWYRAYFRAIQDCKGALRYLVNRNAALRIDTNNIFLAGESAGAFLALGVSLMDSNSEKPLQAFAINDAPKPNTNALNCTYNVGKIFQNNTIQRPDLGSIEGNIEPTSTPFTIKGIGNMYGAMLSNLLQFHPSNKPKPAIFSFHQPCDMVVPMDSGKVFAGLSWCMTNGYNCFAIGNTPKVFGSRAISQWNTLNNHGFTIQNQFTNTNFPFSFLIGAGSCLDQVNNPCHAYDNSELRANQLAQFFAPIISTNPICDTAQVIVSINGLLKQDLIRVFPNPANEVLSVTGIQFLPTTLSIYSIHGQFIMGNIKPQSSEIQINIKHLPSGIYVLQSIDKQGRVNHSKWVKH